MVELMHLIARFLHVGAAMLWVGYLATLGLVILPAARGARGGHAPNLGPILDRMRIGMFFGPATLLFGAWLVTASGHTWGQLLEPGWGHAIIGGIVVSVIMLALEGALIMPGIRKAHAGPIEEREAHLASVQLTALWAAGLGLLAAFLMINARFGGF